MIVPTATVIAAAAETAMAGAAGPPLGTRPSVAITTPSRTAGAPVPSTSCPLRMTVVPCASFMERLVGIRGVFKDNKDDVILPHFWSLSRLNADWGDFCRSHARQSLG